MDTGETPVEAEVAIHRIPITLTSRDVKSLEKVCADLIGGAKDKRLKGKGPVRMSHQDAESDSKENTLWMRIHKRLIDLHGPSEIVKQITSISTEPGVEVEVNIAHA